jgi:hypothetical protein
MLIILCLRMLHNTTCMHEICIVLRFQKLCLFWVFCIYFIFMNYSHTLFLPWQNYGSVELCVHVRM